MIATVFVYRTSKKGSVRAAVLRIVAMLLSLALCLVYLLLFAFHPVGMTALIGLGTLVLSLVGRKDRLGSATSTIPPGPGQGNLSPTI